MALKTQHDPRKRGLPTYKDSQVQEEMTSLPPFFMFGHDWSIGHNPSNGTLNQSCAHQNSHLFQMKSILTLLLYTRQSRFPAASVRDPQRASHLGLEGRSRPLLTASGLVSSGSAGAGTTSWFCQGQTFILRHAAQL